MSSEFCAVEFEHLGQQAADIRMRLDDGWQIVSNHVTATYDCDGKLQMVYTTFMQRKKGIETSRLEALEKRVEQLERIESRLGDWLLRVSEYTDELNDRIDVLEETADTDDVVAPDSTPIFDPLGTLIGWIEAAPPPLVMSRKRSGRGCTKFIKRIKTTLT